MSQAAGVQSQGSKIARALLVIIAAVAAAAFVWPLWWIAITSIRPSADALKYISPFELRTLIPDQISLENYANLITGPFARAIFNSLVVSIVGVVFGLLISAAAAYVFATARFPGREVLFAVLVFSFMIPFEVLAIPLSSTVRDLGMENTYLALVLPGLANGLAIFLLRQFFLGVPPELSEAARIDGASWARIFWKIYVPLSIPALISAGLILFLFQWHAYLWPLLVTTDRTMDVGSVAIARFFGQSYDADYGLIFAAAAVLSLIPALLLLWFQRFFVTSAASSGLKG